MDPSLDSGCLVRMFWPKTKCALLRDDLVLMDRYMDQHTVLSRLFYWCKGLTLLVWGPTPQNYTVLLIH